MAIRNQNEKTALFQTRGAWMSQPEGGFTYVGVLVLVALIGIALASVGQIWHTVQQREKEQELLFIGHEFRVALARYGQNSPGQAGRSPLHLEDLLKDPRAPGIKRYLRKIYVDPMTGSAKWGLVTGPNGEIYGVHSLSDDEPLKKSNFGFVDRQFEGKMKYSEWVFMGSTGSSRRRSLTAPASAAVSSGT
jgi:type II secretory pathway pseudopilin PulG